MNRRIPIIHTFFFQFVHTHTSCLRNRVEFRENSSFIIYIIKMVLRAATSERNGEISCSIEETNRIRKELGLRPLDIDKDEKKIVEVKKKEKTEDDSLRRRLARSKRKREERKSDREFFGTESLVTKDLKKESAKDWIERTKKNSRNSIKKQKIETTTTYESRDLKGIALAHSLSEFKEGETILTLRDTGVLDEDGEDMLENINMTDYDRDAEREERRKKASRPVYVC